MKLMLGIAIIVAAVSASVAAQMGQAIDKPAMGDKTNTTYTGCLEAVNHGGAFLLTHIGEDKDMKDMGKMKDMKDDGAMQGDHMMPSSVALAGSSDLKKHVGEKVTVTGSVSAGSMGTMRNDLDTLKVSSLKVVAKSCS